MSLDVFSDIGTWFSNTMQDFQKIVENNFDNPLFWVLMVVIVIAIAAFSFNSLNK